MTHDQAWQALDFLARYAADREAGQVRDLASYLRLFPGHEEAVAREFIRLESDRAAGEAEEDGEAGGGVVGHYRILRELGRGGQGVVHLAIDTRLLRHVALKVLFRRVDEAEQSAAAARFLREAMVVSKLEHPGICGVYETGVVDGVAFLAMRYVEGESLARLLAAARQQNRPWLELPAGNGTNSATSVSSARPLRGAWPAVHLIEGAARALHAAHEAGIVHRDIKPGNLMVMPKGDPVWLDFGLAHDESRTLDSLTQTGDLFGTPAYLAPEQIEHGSAAASRQSDVWSLAIVLWECLCLRRPFEAATREKLYAAIVQAPLPSARAAQPALPRDLAVVLAVALDKDPARRYATALDFAEDLRRARELQPILAKPPGPILRLGRWTQRNRALAASLAALVLTLCAALGYFVRESGQQRALRIAATEQSQRESTLRATVERQFDDLSRLSTTYLYDLHDALADLPGATAAKRQIVEKALAYLEILKRDPRGAELDAHVVAARLRAGDVLGNPKFANLGQRDAALFQYRAALVLAESLARRATDDARRTEAAGRVALCRARIANVEAGRGQAAEALDGYRAALAALEGGDGERRRLAVDVRIDLADVLLLLHEGAGNVRGALAELERALADCSGETAGGDDLGLRTAFVRTRLAAVRWLLGESKTAVALAAAARDVLGAQPAEALRRLSVRHAMVRCNSLLGTAAIDEGRSQDARLLLQAAVDGAHALYAADPHDELARRALIESRTSFAAAFQATGDENGAFGEYEAALELARDAVPTGSLRRLCARARLGVASVHYERLNLTAASSELTTVHDQLDALIAGGHDDAETRSMRATARILLGAILRRQQQASAARQWLERALVDSDQLMAIDGENRRHVLQRQVLLQNLGVLEARSDPKAMKAHFAAAIALGERQAELRRDWSSQTSLAILEQAFGTLLEESGSSDEARAMLERSAKRLETVVAAAPADYRARRNLAQTLVQLARNAAHARRHDEALARCRRVHELIPGLTAQAQPGNDDAKARLIDASACIVEAAVALRDGRQDEAKAATQRAMDIVATVPAEQRQLFAHLAELRSLRRTLGL